MASIVCNYRLHCLHCGAVYEDDGTILKCTRDHPPAFLRPKYETGRLSVHTEHQGIYRFSDWMPIRRTLEGSGAPVTYRSEGFARAIGLDNLAVTFNGYWPEKDAAMLTGTFKECEAFSVCARLPEDFDKILVIASAGNTARAFARVCSRNNIKLALFVPERLRQALWFGEEIAPCVKLISAGGDSDYYDAIRLSNLAAGWDGFIPEGGALNVARRDGMGTTVLSAVTTLEEIPAFYFQAVGSGTGGIAAWEAWRRFIDSGVYGDQVMKIWVSQNAPFVPLVDSWAQRSREFLIAPEAEAKAQIAEIDAGVLANRKPPYSIEGGLFDALTETEGEVTSASNAQAARASELFAKTEGIDISPAASVAAASLMAAVSEKKIAQGALVMLNITGGGMERYKQEHTISVLEPSLTVDPQEFESSATRDAITGLFH